MLSPSLLPRLSRTSLVLRRLAFRNHSAAKNPQIIRFASSGEWPMPHTREHLENTSVDPRLPKPNPIIRQNESEETMRARLLYQARKRGTLENDLLLSTFARDHLAKMSMEQMRDFDELMDEMDWTVYYWVTRQRPPPERWLKSKVFEKLTEHAKNEGKVIRRMPPLE
ncbi:DUF339-domain-containing protein [Flagelloscypha sp. PMI_526]|nr:DUF339-domain-containing protein [Flagelloscypha sp. PMI_526]